MPKKPRAIDLFAGCGGLTLGLQAAGFRVVLAVESDKSACDTYELNQPSVKLLREDVRVVDLTMELRTVGVARGELDLLAACPPCQGFSTMRTLNEHVKVRDERNDLISEVGAIVETVLPKTFLFENVPNLRHDRRFTRLLSTLKRLGYYSYHEIVDALDFGVPQRRRRLVLAASLLAPPTNYVKHRETRTVGDTIRALPAPGVSGDPLHDYVKPRSPRIQKLLSLIPKDGGSRSSLPTEFVLQCHRKTTGFKDVYGRLSWHAPANTITSGCTNPSKGRFIHPEQDRPLTLREAALLQSFPSTYRFAGTSISAIALQIGNAIPPPLAEAHALALAATLRA